MKYLSDYIQEKQTGLFNECGSFFAFGNRQFEEKIVKGIKYASVGAGLYCPVDKVKALVDGLSCINKEGIALDIEENGIDAIIMRELGNFECQITGEFEDVVERLEDYGVSHEDVRVKYNEFYQYCVENGNF